jgi:uncharacterized protein YcfL
MNYKEKNFCINCFTDINVKDYIKKHANQLGKKNQIDFKCSFCENGDYTHMERYDILDIHYKKGIFYSEDIYTISQEQLIKKFIEIINKHCNYLGDKNPKNYPTESNIGIITDIFYFERTDIISKLAKYDFINFEDFPFSDSVIKHYNCGNDTDYVAYDISFLNYWSYKKNNEVFRWESFCEHTKHKARYFDHKNEYFKLQNELKKFDNMFEKLKETINESTIFRARVVNNSEKQKQFLEAEKNGLITNKLGKAPVSIVKNNRFSPIGISYGYFSFDKQTALCEIRAENKDTVIIGEFKIQKSLNIVNFKNTINFELELNPFNKEFNLYTKNLYMILDEFLKDISKPIKEEDSFLEYVPTQIISEYIWSLGYDGFIFDSSQYEGGKNLVLFGDNPECIKFNFLDIYEKDIDYKYEVKDIDF